MARKEPVDRVRSFAQSENELARRADEYEDGTIAFWIAEFEPYHPEYQLIIVTGKNPERLKELRDLHERWYPR